jgi:hypothetical protein
MLPHIKTSNCLIITQADGQPAQVAVSHPHFNEIYATVLADRASEAELNQMWEYIRPIKRVQRLLPQDSEVQLDLSPEGVLTAVIDGSVYDVPTDLAQTINEVHKASGNLRPFALFLKKLSENPRKEVASELWGFIAACGMTLDEDGNFLAYKNVNEDFTSPYDNKTDNTPGTVLRMRRQDVQHDSHVTCSTGFHFAAWGYLKHYASGRKTVLLSVSPADVVSIPSDYNNMKGRACSYKILREVSQPEELKGKAYLRN